MARSFPLSLTAEAQGDTGFALVCTHENNWKDSAQYLLAKRGPVFTGYTSHLIGQLNVIMSDKIKCAIRFLITAANRSHSSKPLAISNLTTRRTPKWSNDLPNPENFIVLSDETTMTSRPRASNSISRCVTRDIQSRLDVRISTKAWL